MFDSFLGFSQLRVKGGIPDQFIQDAGKIHIQLGHSGHFITTLSLPSPWGLILFPQESLSPAEQQPSEPESAAMRVRNLRYRIPFPFGRSARKGKYICLLVKLYQPLYGKALTPFHG